VNQVLILTGPPGAGKTTVAEALIERYDRMILVSVDDLRHWVKAGYRHPWAGDAQAAEQLAMAIDNACALAHTSISYRYSVVIDDVVLPESAERYQERLQGIGVPVHLVTLLPSLDVTLERDRPRGAASVPERVRALHEQFSAAAAEERQPGIVLDTSTDPDAFLTGDRVQDAVSQGRAVLIGS
jgi:adenylate kinase family enzyme